MKTKKNLFTIVLTFALVFCLTMSLGLVLSHPVKAEAGLPSFAVVNGAQIRISGTDTDNGIRFAADVSKAEYEALEGNKTAGVFIMPYSYIEKFGDIDEANCFSSSAKYTWDGKENGTGTTILHMDSQAVLTQNDEDQDVYRIQGSVVNILDENLDREYVGVPYIAVENEGNTTYYFANGYKENKRSPIEVALNAIKAEDATAQATAENYLESYITAYKTAHGDAAPTVPVNVEIYLSSSEGGYVKSESKSTVKNITINGVEDLTKTYGKADLYNEEEEGFYYIPSKSRATAETMLSLDEDNPATVAYYYDEQAVDVLVDGALTSSTVEDGVAGGGNGYGWIFTNVTPDSYHGKTAKALGFYAHSALGNSANVTFSSAKPLFAPTNKFSLMTKVLYADKYTGSEVTETAVTIKIYSDSSTSQTADVTNIKFEKVKEVGVNDSTYRSSSWQQVNFTLTNPIDKIYKIEISYPSMPDDTAIAFDFFCAEYDAAVNFEIGDNATVNGEQISVKDDQPVSIKVGKPISTVYNCDELVTEETKVTAKQFVNGDTLNNGATGETDALTSAADGYTLTAVDNYYTLSVDISYSIKGDDQSVTTKYTVLGYHKNMLENFDTDITAEGIATATTNDNGNEWMLGALGTGMDGSYSAQGVYASGKTWTLDYKDKDITIDGNCTKVSFWVTTYLTWWSQFQLYVQVNVFGSGDVSVWSDLRPDALEGGWVYVEMDLPKAISGDLTDKTVKLTIPGSSYGGACFDNIAIK